MRATIIIILIALTAATRVCGQGTRMYSGRIIDNETSSPLPFASISIKGKATGTVANESGEFDFFVREQFYRDTLMISHIGYKTFLKCIADLQGKDLTIRLSVMPIALKEITIIEKMLSARDIIAKAVKSLRENYPAEPYCLEGFFREIEEENGRYVFLTEAAVDIYDRKFDGRRKKLIQESIHIREMRRSLRLGERKNDNIGYALADLIENNDVRYNRGTLDTLANSFEMDTITSYQGRIVYQISVSNGTDRGYLYVDAETFGILKVISERKSREPDKPYYWINGLSDSLKLGRKWFIFSVEFEPYKGKLYAKRMHESEENVTYYTHDGKTKTTSIETLEFITTRIHEHRENKLARNLRYGLKLDDVPYHEDFWKNFNAFKPTPLNKRLINDLEREVSLQEQFRTVPGK